MPPQGRCQEIEDQVVALEAEIRAAEDELDEAEREWAHDPDVSESQKQAFRNRIGSANATRRAAIRTLLEEWDRVGCNKIGHFELDYVPLSIVYCPPNEDTSASLAQSESFGTRFTVGSSEGFTTTKSEAAKVTFLGLSMGDANAESRRNSNRNESATEVSHFRSTVVTADNQRSIARAYRGPLADLFVIAVKPKFEVFLSRAGLMTYLPKKDSGDSVIIILPAHKLLRPPQDDKIAHDIPKDVRKRLLELDPFITQLDKFFPDDSGADLTDAANPYVDPNFAGVARAELIGRWWLNQGTELNYSIGQEKELFLGQATESSFTSTMSFSVDFDATVIGKITMLPGFGVSSSGETTVQLGYQSSRETTNKKSTTASCFLIRNQNQADLEGIDLYYDLLFSTLMFRRVPEMVGVAGTISGTDGLPLAMTTVSLIAVASKETYMTVTGLYGNYEFLGLRAGDYAVKVGDKQMNAKVSTGVTRADVPNVRRALDLEDSPVWEIKRSLNVSSKIVRFISGNLDGIFDEKDLAHITGHDQKQMQVIAATTSIRWPRTDLSKLDALSLEEVNKLRRAGIHSIQELWRQAQVPSGLAKIVNATRLPAARVQLAVDRAGARRVSVTKPRIETIRRRRRGSS